MWFGDVVVLFGYKDLFVIDGLLVLLLFVYWCVVLLFVIGE